jgi:dipeptidyl-peptidase-4
MKKSILFYTFLLFLAVSSGFAQKELSLADAVMEQYRKFRPQYVFNFQWIPNSSDYSYVQDFTSLVIYDAKKKKSVRLEITDVNQILGAELRWFSGMKWNNNAEFYLSNGTQYFLYDFRKKTARKILEINKDIEFENDEYSEKANAIAYTRDNNLYIFRDNKESAITTNKDENIVSGQAIARSEFGITNGIFWSPNGAFLAFYQKDETEVSSYPLLDISKIPGVSNLIKYPMAGLKSEKPKVGIYHLNTGKTVFIEPRGDKHDYLTNVSWSADEKFVLIAEITRSQQHMRLQQYDAQTGAFVKTIFEEKNERYVEPEHPAYFINATQFIWLSEQSGNTNLYLCNLDGAKEQITFNKWEALSYEGISRNGRLIYFMGTGESPLDTKLFQVDLRTKVQTELTKESGTHSAQLSPNDMLIYHQFSSGTVPNLAKIIDLKGRTLSTLVKADEKLVEYKIGTAEINKLKASDGSELYTRIIKPSNFDPNKKYPVMVYVYGGPHAQMITNSWLYGANLWMYWMAEQGYLVFTLDNRGSAHRGFDFESQIHRQVGTIEIEDQMVGVEYLKSLPYVDAKRMAVHGWSFGGFMTISLMLRQPGVFTTGVAGGPVTDWKFYEVMYGERYMDMPEENPEGYEKASLLNKASNLKGKLLIIHGGIDDVVVPQHSQSLLKAFIEKGKQVDFFEYPTHKHNVTGKDRVHLIEKILKYIIDHNV